MIYPNGSKYIGEWKNGKMDGQGTFNFPSGNKYVGKYKDGNKWNVTKYDKKRKFCWGVEGWGTFERSII